MIDDYNMIHIIKIPKLYGAIMQHWKLPAQTLA